MMLGICYKGRFSDSALEVIIYGNPDSPETWERAEKRIEILHRENPDREYWIEEVEAP